MKYKITFITALLVVLNCLNSKATDFNSFNFNFIHYAKIAAIDKELNQAKSVEEIKVVALKMYAIVCEHFNDTCPPPKENDYKALCLDIASRAKAPSDEIEYYEYTYEKRLLLLACVNVKLDDEETIKKKVQLFWNKYKAKCKCDSVAFGIQNGNILKFALSQNMPEVIETFASTYGLDINFVDPADGLNLLDYLISEIGRLKKLQNSGNTVKVYEDYKAGVIGLGGKSNKK